MINITLDNVSKDIINLEQVKKTLTNPSYAVGDCIKISNWDGTSHEAIITDIKLIYDYRGHCYTWGYSVSPVNPVMHYAYIPEGYVRGLAN